MHNLKLTLNFVCFYLQLKCDLCLHACVSELVHAHSPDYETSIVDKAGSKWHIQRAPSTDPSCPINDQHTALNPFLYMLLLCGLLAFFL